MRDIVRRRGSVAIEHARRLPTEARPVTIVGRVDGVGVGVSALEEEAAGDAAIDGGLQRVIGAVGASVKLAGGHGAPEFGVKRAAVIAATGYLRSIDVQEGEAVDRGRSNVSDGAYQLARQLAFHDVVPRLDVAAVQLPVGHRVAHVVRPRQRNPPLADIGAADRWNTAGAAQT